MIMKCIGAVIAIKNKKITNPYEHALENDLSNK